MIGLSRLEVLATHSARGSYGGPRGAVATVEREMLRESALQTSLSILGVLLETRSTCKAISRDHNKSSIVFTVNFKTKRGCLHLHTK